MPLLPPQSAGFEPPPAASLEVLEKLRAGLRAEIPKKSEGENLLIGTWNVKQFARVTGKWTTGAGDNPKRNLQDMCAIAEVISRFDVVAVVEVKRNLEAFRLLMSILGKDWGFIVSDTVEGQAGNNERLGYICDLRRIRPSGMVGELVVPDEELDKPQAELTNQFARTPYTASFRAGPRAAFTLVSLHILYGSKGEPEKRTPELRSFARWLRRRAEDPDEFNRNLIALGDFNIDRHDDANWRAFVVEQGLSPPDKLMDVPRTVGDTKEKHSFYDQIAWFTKGKRAALTLEYRDAGGFEWTKHILEDVKQSEKEARISDHYPLWAEFSLGD